MPKLILIEPDTVAFWCPGCECLHAVNLDQSKQPRWTLTGGLDEPTLAPSVLYERTPRCHSLVRAGKIQFLADCAHDLAGQTVELEGPDLV